MFIRCTVFMALEHVGLVIVLDVASVAWVVASMVDTIHSALDGHEVLVSCIYV